MVAEKWPKSLVLLQAAETAVGILDTALRDASRSAGTNDSLFMAHLCARKALLELGYVKQYLTRKEKHVSANKKANTPARARGGSGSGGPENVGG